MNLRSLIKVIVFFSVGMLIGSTVLAHSHHGHGEKKSQKKGILLVAFGSSYPQAQISFKNIESEVKEAFPRVPVRWAYTSKIIRDKMAKKGKDLKSVAQALADIRDEGFTHVAVQSLHTISGAEFHDLQSVVNAFNSMPGEFEQILVGRPLLSSHEDLIQVRQAMLENIPDQRQEEEAVIFMGHGTHHPSNAFYAAMAYEFQQKDPNVYVGTVEGSPSLKSIMSELKAKGTEKVYLMPFMSVAGDHVRNDMAGDRPESWKSILKEAGFKCETVLKGTAEYDNIVAIWLEHLQGVLYHF